MSEQRYRYLTVGLNDDREAPVAQLGKQNATFDVSGWEFERVAILKLPRKMTRTEFDTWKESNELDLVDIYFHCIHQNDPQQIPTEEGKPVADGGSSMPKLALEHLKELDSLDSKIGEWLSEATGEPMGGITDLYASPEYSIEEAQNEIPLGDGFAINEPEYIELLGLVDAGRQAAADDPPTLGTRNRLLSHIILANPEAYARVRKEMTERAEERAEAVKQLRNQERHRQQTSQRANLSKNGVDIPLDGEDEEENDG